MKDAYYFPHFYNARNDRKIRRLRKSKGIEGYGVYFMLLEILREQSGFKYPVEDIDLIAEEIKTSEENILEIINDYGLFTIESGYFYSSKLIEFLQPYLEKSQKARAAANKRWKKAATPEGLCAPNANAMQTQCKRITKAMPMYCTGKAMAMQVKIVK